MINNLPQTYGTSVEDWFEVFHTTMKLVEETRNVSARATLCWIMDEHLLPRLADGLPARFAELGATDHQQLSFDGKVSLIRTVEPAWREDVAFHRLTGDL